MDHTKIAILTCLHSNDVCARVGCLNAFNRRSDFFRDYGPEVELGALMTCNGCKGHRPQEPAEDPGILEKADRLISEGIQTVHVGVCRLLSNGQECPRMTAVCRVLEEKGIKIVRGTHREA